MKLRRVLKDITAGRIPNIEIKSITPDSRKVRPGAVFVAYGGVAVDGHTFIPQAIKAGAVAVVGEKKLSLPVPYFRVKNGRLAWAQMVANFYGNPEKKLKIIGVTGTDGKTTTATLIYRMLEAAHCKVGLVSTIGAKIGKREMETGLHTTSPDPEVLWKLLDEMVGANCEYAVLEVTSHGLAQERFGDIEFLVGVLTNVGSDHLEFHKNRENYLQAKALLFERSSVSVFNRRSWGLDYLKRRASGEVILYEGKDYVEENILAASAAARALGVDEAAIKTGIENLGQLSGRFQRVENTRGLNLIVDFAHTEQGVRAVLSRVRKMKKRNERLLAVFGCNGERDQTKRAPMGRAAVELADLVVVTTEDPRRESVEQIYKQIEEGCLSAGGVLGKTFFREDDRREAIEFVINKLAKKGDWLLFLGKGHEKSMNIAGIETPWDEVQVIKETV
jgi:UDP-N-acetylmuramoyl-L-alanyl-D-glutamate--2,6-diaminopimelate ligase